MGSKFGEAARTAAGFIPGIGAGVETVRQEARRGTNPVAIAIEAAWDSGLNLVLPGTETALKNWESSSVRNKRGEREVEELPFGHVAFVATLDTAFSLAKVAASSAVGHVVGPEAGIATFVLLHEIQEKMGLEVIAAIATKVLKPNEA